jgi:hypothetical protein
MILPTSRSAAWFSAPDRRYAAFRLRHDDAGSFEKLTSEPGMSMKTEGRCGQPAIEAGMCMKKKALRSVYENVNETT